MTNKEINKVGEPRKFDFKTLSHSELGKKHALMDFEITNKTSGARFVVLKKIPGLKRYKSQQPG